MSSNPVVFFDVAIGGHFMGRITMELFADTVPKTAENFLHLCTGEFRRQGNPVGYKGSKFHRYFLVYQCNMASYFSRIIKNFMVQGGDFLRGDGSGSQCIYGDFFDDENFILKHNGPGLLSMANSGPNTNGCQFFITCAPCDFLDGKHVIFGRIIEGMNVVRMIENVPAPEGRPKLEVVIEECGQMY